MENCFEPVLLKIKAWSKSVERGPNPPANMDPGEPNPRGVQVGGGPNPLGTGTCSYRGWWCWWLCGGRGGGGLLKMFRELPTKSDGRWALSPESALIFISFSGPPPHLPLTSCSEPRTKFYNVSFAQCGHCCQISVGFEYGRSVPYLVKWSFSSFAFDYS